MEEIVKQVLAILNGMWKFRWHGLIAAWVVAIVGVIAVYGLEVLVAAIQAYVFTILTCVYLKDALHPSH